MTGVIVEAKIFEYLLDLKMPKIVSHCRSLQLDLSPIIYRWFLCIFIGTLSLSVKFFILRKWIEFYCFRNLYM
jgi:hypothetical protein